MAEERPRAHSGHTNCVNLDSPPTPTFYTVGIIVIPHLQGGLKEKSAEKLWGSREVGLKASLEVSHLLGN